MTLCGCIGECDQKLRLWWVVRKKLQHRRWWAVGGRHPSSLMLWLLLLLVSMTMTSGVGTTFVVVIIFVDSFSCHASIVHRSIVGGGVLLGRHGGLLFFSLVCVRGGAWCVVRACCDDGEGDGQAVQKRRADLGKTATFEIQFRN